MSNKRDPLFSDLDFANRIQGDPYRPVTIMCEIRDIYEAARAKDAELIQRLVNDLASVFNEDRPSLVYAAAAGFKPSEQ